MRRLAQLADPYIALLLGTVLLAVFLPASGEAAAGLGWGTKAAVGLIFFLYGARLSTREAFEGLRHWRLQVLVLLCTFAVFPLIGLATRALVPYVLTPGLQAGLLFLCLVPSTVQSSIAFTSVARGNVPAAICAGTYSSLLGMVATPLLAAWLIGGHAALGAEGIVGIVCQLLAPFVAGQLLRRWIGGFITRHHRVLGHVDRGAVLLVVYTAFSQGMTEGIWGRVTPLRLVALLGVEAALLALMLTLTWYGASRLGFTRADRVVTVFAGSNKSLAAGLPMASVLFGAQASLAVLPLMLFHQMQLIVCAFLSRRWAAKAPEASTTEGSTRAVAAGGSSPGRKPGRKVTAGTARRR
ncbi:bile acid:sodium symporter family protein [Streptomyces sp. WMMB 322]|uniref:bile acid:sodium symporter family protein n=1 Tax=Streptomyces sp. WMMB 322 TaxID=1286821 RepID=UPI000823A5B9|nr:bile acid:sodium symporter family protein [Streptomyces sp. WMMB 322]SCK35596.1 solute carrier family 10 (sodium/bile acid cotransporter), member 7 [Streptomyces sp. WMMB 322]